MSVSNCCTLMQPLVAGWTEWNGNKLSAVRVGTGCFCRGFFGFKQPQNRPGFGIGCGKY